MKALIRGMVPAWLILVQGCSSIGVTTDFDPSADFSSYETFAWMTEGTAGEGDQSPGPPDERIKSAVEAQLIAKGINKATADPDLVVVYQADQERRPEAEEWGYGGWWGAGGGEAYSYEEGTLIIELVDGKTKKLVWRGTAKKVLSDHPSTEDREAAIDRAIQKMFEKYPPS